MNITHQFLGLEAQDSWRRLVAQLISNLQSLTTMTAADVILEHQPGIRPSFRVQVLLEVFGADLRAEATDRTRQAALLKVTDNLERQIRARGTRLPDRPKSQPPLKASSSPGMRDSLGS